MREQKQAMDRIIFYLPYGFGALESGSRVRPYKMYQAFLNLGYQVDLIAGTPKERMKQFQKIIAQPRDYAFCYFEASTYPIHPLVDYRILLGFRRRGIPVGIYYRDAYWKFSDYFRYRGRKRLELLLRYHTDLFFFSKVASVIFFPTDSLASLFKLKVPVAILPPGGELKPVRRGLTYVPPLRAVYVGGVTERYGIGLMLKALQLVNKDEILIYLHLICRKDELQSLPDNIRRGLEVPWVSIHHVSGKENEGIYERCHIGLIPLVKDAYNDLAMPVKLFEYLSYGIPVVATHCKEMSNFIEANRCGLISKDDAQSLANTLHLLVRNPNMVRELGERALQTIRNGNTWEDRAKYVAKLLKEGATPKTAQ